MSRKMSLFLASLSISIAILATGCGKPLTFTKGELKVYQVANEQNKKDAQWSGKIAFVQKIDNVNPDGSAAATITLKNLQYFSAEDTGNPVHYDSNLNQDAIRKIMGQAYSIQINPSGKVTVLEDTLPKGISEVVAENVIAGNFLGIPSLKAQHESVFKKQDQVAELPYVYLKLSYSKNQTDTFRAISEVVKDFRFEQPNLNKLREEQTKTVIDMTFTQTIDRVDEAGNAATTITIKGLAVEMTNKNELKYAYNSTDPKDEKSPMGKLLGQSYTIELSPNGQVKVLDAKAALAAVKGGYEKKVATSILDEKNIIDRHQIMAMPKSCTTPYIVSDNWVDVVASPPGLLAPKNYEKVYTLTNVDTRDGATIATVKMDAGEDTDAPAGKISGGMGVFAKMFDNEDNYTGTMTLNTDSGSVLTMEETLVSTYLAQEMPEKGDPEKGPDTLTMQFTNRVKLEKLD